METTETSMVRAQNISRMQREGKTVKVKVNNDWLTIEGVGVPVFNIGSYFMRVKGMPFDFVVPANKVFPVQVI